MLLVLLFTLVVTHSSHVVTSQDCDLSQPIISDCVADISDTWWVEQDTELTNVTLTCHGGPEPCVTVTDNVNLEIRHSTITGNNTRQCILLQPSSTLHVANVKQEKCGNWTADIGGFIYGFKDNKVTVTESVLKDNRARFGGAIALFDGGELDISGSELSRNYV